MIDSSAKIDKSASVSEDAHIGANVIISPHVIIEGGVVIGDNTIIEPFCIIREHSTLGKNNHIYQFSSIGEACQDLKYKGEPTTLTIGDNNTIREHCTIHRGTVQGLNTTTIGSNNLFMVNTHVAHDCVIGDNCIFANNATLAGHVTIGSYVIFGGLSAIHQFGRVGSHAFIAGMAALNMDVPPYVLAAGLYAKAHGINKVGLARRGFSSDAINAIKKAYMIIYHKHNTIEEACVQLQELAKEHSEVQILADFISENGRGIVR